MSYFEYLIFKHNCTNDAHCTITSHNFQYFLNDHIVKSLKGPPNSTHNVVVVVKRLRGFLEKNLSFVRTQGLIVNQVKMSLIEGFDYWRSKKIFFINPNVENRMSDFFLSAI